MIENKQELHPEDGAKPAMSSKDHERSATTQKDGQNMSNGP